MKVAVLSDIHGNYIALERCLEYIFEHNISTLFFLGDYIGELAYPERTMKLLYDLKDKYKCYFVKGNKEDYWLNYSAYGENCWKDGDSTTGSLLYAYESLTSKDMDFFKQLKPSQKVKMERMPELIICHGSPDKVNQKMLPNDSNTTHIIESSDTDIILCGHTHLQGKIVHNGKVVLNPGSVGVPLENDGRTQFLILHGSDGNWTEEFVSLDYDFEKAIRELKEAELDKHAPSWGRITEAILRGCNISHGKVLSRAMDLCKEENGVCNWPDVPEKFWEKAVKELLA